ncbi:MAG: hypothetical protein ABIZ52_01810 [Candidatus Limnocylindrales bacterium]
MRARRPFALATVLSLVIASCGNQASPVAPSHPDATPTAAPSAAFSPSIAPTESAGTPILQLGVQAVTPRQSLLTVFGWKPSGRSSAPPSGAMWYEADVEFCLAPQIQSAVPVETIRDELAAELVSGTIVTPDVFARSPAEVFSDTGRQIVAEECLRGALPFAIPTDDPARYVGLFRAVWMLRWAIPSG